MYFLMRLNYVKLGQESRRGNVPDQIFFFTAIYIFSLI